MLGVLPAAPLPAALSAAPAALSPAAQSTPNLLSGPLHAEQPDNWAGCIEGEARGPVPE